MQIQTMTTNTATVRYIDVQVEGLIPGMERYHGVVRTLFRISVATRRVVWWPTGQPINLRWRVQGGKVLATLRDKMNNEIGCWNDYVPDWLPRDDAETLHLQIAEDGTLLDYEPNLEAYEVHDGQVVEVTPF